MHPPIKDQSNFNDFDSPGVDASDGALQPEGTFNKDVARQEFKLETDINYMLSRFGITQPRGTPVYGIWDDTIDLQQAIASVEEARAGYAKLPEVLRKKFPSMEAMLTAIENGALVIKDENAPEPVKSEMDKLNDRLAAAEKALSEAAPAP